MNMNYSTCIVCKKTSKQKKNKYIAAIWDKDNIFSKLNIYTCVECGFGMATPEPNKTHLIEFYKNVYRRKDSPFFIDFSRIDRPFYRDHRSISQLLLVLNYVELKNNDMFVDVGPGAGYSYNELIETFGKNLLDLCAIEFSRNAGEYYKTLYNVQTFTDLNTLVKQTKKKPKLLLSSHCLEHFNYREVQEFLELVKETLSEDGCCIFEVPHQDFRIHEDQRNGDDPHLIFFSKDSFKQIFINCGFNVLFIETCGPIKSQVALGSNKKTIFSVIKRICRNLISASFKLVPNKIKKLIRDITPTILLKVNIKDENFQYSGNRECLRIVARPISKDSKI